MSLSQIVQLPFDASLQSVSGQETTWINISSRLTYERRPLRRFLIFACANLAAFSGTAW